jgi:hypothetical protein
MDSIVAVQTKGFGFSFQASRKAAMADCRSATLANEPRLSRIVTGTGDSGTTGFTTGERAPKWDDRIEVFDSLPLKDFVLPGVNAFALRYFDRVSDDLYVAARTLARAERAQEIIWCKR